MLIFSYAPYGLAEGLKLSGKCARLYIILYFHVFLDKTSKIKQILKKMES